MSAGERISFAALFERHPEVCIPILQRDYAQGRASEAEVRGAFLQALRDALDKPEDDPTLPLDLDFVYGSLDSAGAFAPLDGQQRLTTLLLLHWYLATKDGHMLDFMRLSAPARGARFTYAVRPSSREFFDALLDWQPEQWVGSKLSAVIADQPWFFLSWKMDPTIQSALTMLDDIDARFADTKGGYARLTSCDRPAVTFQLLDLQDFGLSDDLYIKMNARGKLLTSFETFKARLEHHVDSVLPDDRFELHGQQMCASEYIGHRIDTAWADVLWHYRAPDTALFDDRFMNLVRAVVTVTRRPGGKSHDGLMQALRNGAQSFSFIRYQEAGCLDEAFVRTFVALLDAWSGCENGIRPLLPEGHAFDERAFIERLLMDATRLSFADLVQFSAYCGFLTRHIEAPTQAFGEWLRVVVNLSSNTPYDGIDDFTRSSQSVQDLLTHAEDILPYLAWPAGTAVRGFYGQQVREERIKASLLLRDADWRSVIEPAERHNYFAGQIEFLLDFAGVLENWNEQTGVSWTPEEEADRIATFVRYRDKAFAVFSGNGLTPMPNFLWERALLAHGDYLLHAGRNHSLLHNAERDESWKRLLRAGPSPEAIAKRKLVQAVLDDIDLTQGVTVSLTELLRHATPDEPWRALLVHHPDAIAYCRLRNVRRGAAGRLYLLRKTRMSGDHAELLTYVLYCRLSGKKNDGDYVSYVSVSTDEIEPFILGWFAGLNGRLQFQVKRDKEELIITASPDEVRGTPTMPQGFVDEMTVRGFGFNDGRLFANASLALAEPLLLELSARAKAWDFQQVPAA